MNQPEDKRGERVVFVVEPGTEKLLGCRRGDGTMDAIVTATMNPDGGIGIVIGSEVIGTVDVGGTGNNISVEV